MIHSHTGCGQKIPRTSICVIEYICSPALDASCSSSSVIWSPILMMIFSVEQESACLSSKEILLASHTTAEISAGYRKEGAQKVIFQKHECSFSMLCNNSYTLAQQSNYNTSLFSLVGQQCFTLIDDICNSITTECVIQRN